MAFQQKQIFPNDLRPRVAIGFDLPLNGKAVLILIIKQKMQLKQI